MATRWNLDPVVVCMETDWEYRVVTVGLTPTTLAVCDTRAEAETACETLKSLPDLVATLRDISAALDAEDEPLSALRAAAWKHAGFRIAVLTGRGIT